MKRHFGVSNTAYKVALGHYGIVSLNAIKRSLSTGEIDISCSNGVGLVNAINRTNLATIERLLSELQVCC